MMPHEISIAAGARLQHWWELHGVAANPTPTIRRIAGEMAPTKPQVRHEIELHLHDAWARMRASEEGE